MHTHHHITRSWHSYIHHPVQKDSLLHLNQRPRWWGVIAKVTIFSWPQGPGVKTDKRELENPPYSAIAAKKPLHTERAGISTNHMAYAGLLGHK